jgi:hypothetical protein
METLTVRKAPRVGIRRNWEISGRDLGYLSLSNFVRWRKGAV